MAARTRRQTLRFCYTMNYRIPQYVRHVRCISTTEYAYLDGADPGRLSELVRTGKLQPDDARAATDTAEEDEVLQQISARRWEQLMRPLASASTSAMRPVHRRWMYRPIGQLRQALPRGDL